MRTALAKHDFATVLTLLRQFIPLTQREIGDIVGIDQAVVSRIENGRQQVTHTSMLLRLVEGLQIPARYVLPVAILKETDRGARRSSSASESITACGGMNTTWDDAGSATIMEDWLKNADSLDFDHRIIKDVHGSGITLPGWQYVESLLPQKQNYNEDLRQVTPPAMDFIDATIDYLRRVDDMEGGNPNNLTQVHHHFLTVGRYMKSRMASNSLISKRLHNAVAQLAQIACWMCYDADDHGRAQRYFLTALHASRSSEDLDHGAYVLAFQGYQSAYRARYSDALQLTRAAISVAPQIHPMVHAQLYSWQGHAQAASGDVAGAQASWEMALNIFSSPTAKDCPPKWLYWLSEEELISQKGEALNFLAAQNNRHSHSWLAKANACLMPKAIPNDTSYPRSATYNALWLVRNYIRQNEIERALNLGNTVIHHDYFVCSPRSASLLTAIDIDLAERGTIATEPAVKEFRSRIIEIVGTEDRR